jgi:hypothetical protein
VLIHTQHKVEKELNDFHGQRCVIGPGLSPLAQDAASPATLVDRAGLAKVSGETQKSIEKRYVLKQTKELTLNTA